jgi:hypothetical protein
MTNDQRAAYVRTTLARMEADKTYTADQAVADITYRWSEDVDANRVDAAERAALIQSSYVGS